MMAAGKAAGSGDAPFDALWEEDRTSSDVSLLVDVSGFEGPLDLLLHLARGQKVDLARISIRALAEQYLEFVRTAQGAAHRAGGGLSRHGGMARLSQEQAAVSKDRRRRRRERRGARGGAGVPAETA